MRLCWMNIPAPLLDVQDGEMRYILHAVGYFIGQEATQLSSHGFDRDFHGTNLFWYGSANDRVPENDSHQDVKKGTTEKNIRLFFSPLF